MREFLRRRASGSASLSLIDCRAISATAYTPLASSTRPRTAWSGYPSTPFAYHSSASGHQTPTTDGEVSALLGGEYADKPVLKTFWSWRRVGVPKPWREALVDAERNESISARIMRAEGGLSVRGSERKKRWWGREEEEDRGCIIM